MPEMKIDTEGRNQKSVTIEEQTADKVVSVVEYDDGTILKIIMNAGSINVECNKTLVIQSDGYTVKIV